MQTDRPIAQRAKLVARHQCNPPLRQQFILRIWRELSTPQRMHLIAWRHGRIGDVTLGDIERVRRELPSGGES